MKKYLLALFMFFAFFTALALNLQQGTVVVYQDTYDAPSSNPDVISGIVPFYYWQNTLTNDYWMNLDNDNMNLKWMKIVTDLNIESEVTPIISAAISAISVSTVHVGSASTPNLQESSTKFIATTAITSSGMATFYLTDNGTSTGNALCTTTVFTPTINIDVNDAANSYRASSIVSSDLKSLKATVNQASGVTLLGITVLGGLTPAPNGTVVQLNLICQ